MEVEGGKWMGIRGVHTGGAGGAVIRTAVALFIFWLFMWTHGEATWIHDDLVGGIMRNGEVYAAQDVVVAVGVDAAGAPTIPLGTRLLICAAAEEGDGEALGGRGTCVVGEVKDTGLFPPGDIDLSPVLFERLAPMSRGRVKVVWTVLE